MEVTELGIVVFLQPAINVLVAVSIMALQLLRESYFGLSLATEIEARLEQSSNARSPMVVTELGMLMLVSPEQPENASSPMEVTELGMLMLVRLEQPENASSPMEVTELGMAVFMQPAINVLVAVSIIALQLLRES